MNQRYIASISFGKDSLAMLLQLIAKSWPLTEVVFYDTGKEFNAIYRLRDKILPLLKANNIVYTELTPTMDFDYNMFEKTVNAGKLNEHKGYSWCGGMCRWGTTEKLKAIEKYCCGAVEYVGIAADEITRLEKERKGNKVFPLATWKMTERDCLKFCLRKGYDWRENNIELYKI